jgi:hypothetical protein
MFRGLFLAATAAALAGCAGSESATQAEFRADDAKCRSYGADTSTDAYVQCRLAIDLQKANCRAGCRSSAAAAYSTMTARLSAASLSDNAQPPQDGLARN